MGGGVRDGRADDRLIAIVCHAHDKQSAALRNDGGIEFCRTLAGEAEKNTAFAAFLRDSGQRATGWTESERTIRRRVAMGFFAYEQYRKGAFAPESKLERHSAQNRDDRIDHFRRKTAELHDCHRLIGRRYAKQVTNHLRHCVAADIGVFKYEVVARVVTQRFDARDEFEILHTRRAVLQLT